MKIFFTGSQRGRPQYGEAYTKLQRILEESNIEFISPQSHKYLDILDQKSIKKLSEDEIHYLFVSKAIELVDAVIIEASMDTFRLGHESTLALIYNKPVLCLSQHRDYSKSIRHPSFYGAQYSDLDDLEIKVKKFTREVESKLLSIRFNGMMSPRQKSFIEWLGREESKSLSEIIRDLIDSKMAESVKYEDDFGWLSEKYLKSNK
jgi:hypothetical protein